MPFNHSLDNFDYESYCFVDEDGFEKSIDHSFSAADNFIGNNTNYRQILIEQINQLQANNQKLIEIGQQYKSLINSLVETIRKRDRTVVELEVKLNKNALNFTKLQQFLHNKLDEMEIYKQKFVREKFLNRQLLIPGVSTATLASQCLDENNTDIETSESLLNELCGICLVCEHKLNTASNRIGDGNCCGVVIDECHDDEL